MFVMRASCGFFCENVLSDLSQTNRRPCNSLETVEFEFQFSGMGRKWSFPPDVAYVIWVGRRTVALYFKSIQPY